MTKNQRLATGLGLLAVTLWATVATAFKLSLTYLSPLQLVFFSCLSCIICLSGILLVQRRLLLVIQLLKQRPLYYFLLGSLNPFAYYLLLFAGYNLLPAQQAQPINYTWAITLTLLAVPFLKQRLYLADIVAMAVCYSGVIVICTQGSFIDFDNTDPLGLGYILISTIIWSLYWIINTKQTADPIANLLACFMGSLPLTAITTFYFDPIFHLTWQGVAGTLYIGFFEMGVTYVLWLFALRYAEQTAKVSNLIFLAPFLSLYFIATILNEPIHHSVYSGVALIIGGILIQQRFSNPNKLSKTKTTATS
ncbi:DMT family transporter [Zooshikella ganghwensis]|uniref:DMT family transporter n=1 Tax=Zooshikella ganghwensis TaxID=202772 RepID=UPI00041C80E9|nr:DMT family transporter [Zooshikella ganghwensis]